jgi:putative Holliday junction resolvase
MPTILNSILALDVGEKRVGVALASLAARLPRPLTTLPRDATLLTALEEIMRTEGVSAVVVGLPRNLQGDSTDQTRATEVFITELRNFTDRPIYTQDEALTSQKAETELQARGKAYDKGDIDALAATYILEDFLLSHPRIEKELSV